MSSSARTATVNTTTEREPRNFLNNSFIERKAFAGPRHKARPSAGRTDPGVDSLSVICCSSNLGNADPTSGANANGICSWIPKNGGGADIIAVGVQEGDYTPHNKNKKAFNEVLLLHPTASQRRQSATKVSAAFVESDDEDDEPSADGSTAISIEPGTGAAGSTPNAVAPTNGRAHLVHLINEAVGKDYMLVKEATTMQMRLRVYVHVKHREGLANVSKDTENTGLGHVVGNKGAQVVAFSLFNVSFCFVSAHLAAHEAHKFYERRNQDYHEICSQIKVGNRHLGLDAQFHHAFWMGDLNYRLNVASNPDWTGDFDARWAKTVKMVGAKKYDELYKLDQLADAIAKKEAFFGWNTPKPDFPPTFKVARDEVDVYHEKKNRIPSWCDRVLYKSLPQFESEVEVVSYESKPEFKSSDHKPIVGKFKVNNIGRKVAFCAPQLKPSESYYGLTISNVELSLSKDAHATTLDVPDPYFAVFSDPAGLLVDKAAQSSKACLHVPVSQRYNNVFATSFSKPVEMRALIAPGAGSEAAFAKCHALISVLDHNNTHKDRKLGSLSLGLGKLWAECSGNSDGKTTVEEVMTYNGGPAGSLKFQVEFRAMEVDGSMATKGCSCEVM